MTRGTSRAVQVPAVHGRCSLHSATIQLIRLQWVHDLACAETWPVLRISKLLEDEETCHVPRRQVVMAN